MNKQAGFSLIQVMIAAGLMAGVAVLGMKIFQNQGKMTNKITQGANITEFRLNLITLLNRAETCTNALNGVKIGEDFQNLWFTDPDKIFMSVGDNLAGSSQKITNLRVLSDAEAQAAGLDVAPPASDGTKLAYLRIGLQDQKNVIGGKDKYLYFKVVAIVGDLRLVKHYSIQSTKQQCSTLGGLLYDSNKNHFSSYNDENEEKPLIWSDGSYNGECLIPGGTPSFIYKCGS